MSAIFGGSSSQSQQGASTNQTVMNPYDAQQIRDQQTRLQDQGIAQNADLQSARNNLGYGAPRFNYGYEMNAGQSNNFQAPQLGPDLNATGQQLLSQSLGQSRAGLGTQLNQIQSQFGQGANSNQGLANILKQQAQQQNQLNNNPLLMQALGGQNQMAMQQAGLNNQATQLANQANLTNAQFKNEGLGQTNSLINQNMMGSAQLGQQQLQNQNALLQSLQGLGQQFGMQYGTQGQSQSSNTAGLLQQVMGIPGNLIGKVAPGVGQAVNTALMPGRA